jgi:hypothetical protein
MDYFEVITNANTGEVTIRPYTDAEIEVVNAARGPSIRRHRDNLLATEVDPLVTNPLRWADLTSDQQAAWTQYRRALLDITAQAGFPNEVVWPTKPE